MIELPGDATNEDWIACTGMTYEEYVAPLVKELKDKELVSVHHDRPELFRDRFNALVRNRGEDLHTLCAEFYTDDLYSRINALELGCVDIVRAALGHVGSKVIAGQLEDKEWPNTIAQVFPGLQLALDRFGMGLSILDHGFGRGTTGLPIALMLPRAKVILYDFDTPTRRVLQRAVERMPVFDNVRFVYPNSTDGANTLQILDSRKFHYVTSTDVMEHIPEPLGELKRLSKLVHMKGVVRFSVYFNGDNERDPSHLKENEDVYNYSDQCWVDDCKTVGGLDLVEETSRWNDVFSKEREV